MVRLVPIEKRPIPMVVLVNMHLISHVVYLGTGQFQRSIGTNRKAPDSNGSTGEFASH